MSPSLHFTELRPLHAPTDITALGLSTVAAFFTEMREPPGPLL